MDRTQLERRQVARSQGSPTFSWAVPATAAGAQSQIEIQTYFPALRKYGAPDFIEIVNNDVTDVTLTINNDETWTVPAGTIRRETLPAIRQLGVTNNDTVVATTLNKIIVKVSVSPVSIDDIVQERQ